VIGSCEQKRIDGIAQFGWQHEEGETAICGHRLEVHCVDEQQCEMAETSSSKLLASSFS